jgi:ADP-heptose:LPS heptosyltransferase
VSDVRTGFLKRADATVGAALCSLAGRVNYWRRREIHLAPLVPDRVRRVLVVRPGGIGDLLLLLPALDALRRGFPVARVDVLCERRNLPALELAGWEGGVLLYDRPAECLSRLRCGRWDVAVDSEQFHNFSALLAWWSGAAVRVGFNINPRRNPLYTHLVHYAPDGREADQFRRLLAPLGIEAPPVQPGWLAGRAFAMSAALADAWQRAAGSRPVAVLHDSGDRPFKRWGEARFEELAAALQGEGYAVVRLGLRRGRASAEGAGPASRRTLDLRGQTTLADSAASLQRASVLVAVDAGLAHLAVALGTPAVVLFGPSDSAKWGWTGPRHTVISRALPCSPCSLFGYHKPCHEIPCMRGIEVRDVLQAARCVARPRVG